MTATAALDDGRFWLTAGMEIKADGGVGGNGVWRSEMNVRRNGCLNEFGMVKSEVFSPESEDSVVEDEVFARLTQRLSLSDSRNVSLLDLRKSPEGLKVSGGSPQSTLGGFGSWSNHNSPPPTPFNSDDHHALGLIYAAADQVARLEKKAENPWQACLNGDRRAVNKPKPLQNPNAGLFADLQVKQKYMAAATQANEAALLWELHLQNTSIPETYSNSRYVTGSENLKQSAAWPPLQQGNVALKRNLQSVPLSRKESAGTGVFIPRRYDANSTLPPRKRTVAPCAIVPAKVVQALNTSIETMSSSRSRPHCISIPTEPSLSHQSYDALMARRRALLDQQHRSNARRTEDMCNRSLEACLPQEWSY